MNFLGSVAALATRSEFLGAIAGASRANLSAYVLEPGSALVRALEAASDRGARVSVRLEGHPGAGRPHGSDGLVARNRAVAVDLARHGVTVHLTTATDVSLHMKAALIDGIAYLDDRNWPQSGSDTIVSTADAADVAVVASALAGNPGSDARLATEKRAALALEAATIAGGSGDRVDVESETFGYSAVSKALYERARAGAHVRVLVTDREYRSGGRTERGALSRLARAGAEIRVAPNDEKLCVAGDRGWIGSANATFDAVPTLDWGMTTCDPAVVRGAAAAFERNWAAGKPAAGLTR